MATHTQTIIDLVKSMNDNHAALWGPAHVIFEDYNLGHKLFVEALHDRDSEWIDYIKDQVTSQRMLVQVLPEIESVFDVLFKLSHYDDDEIDAAQDAFIGD